MFTRLLLIITLALGLGMGSARADNPDQGAMQQVISGQLDAFRAGDQAKAYSYAAPLIQNFFPTVGGFTAMVKKGYDPIYSNKSYSFGSLVESPNGQPLQHVIIVSATGKRYEAIYAMQKQDDGSWKIAGCQLVELAAVDA